MLSTKGKLGTWLLWSLIPNGILGILSFVIYLTHISHINPARCAVKSNICT